MSKIRVPGAMITFILFLLSLLPMQTARADDWSRFESKNFIVTSNGPKGRAEDYLHKLAAFRHLNLLMLKAGADDMRTQVKFNIVLLKSEDEMKKVRPALDKKAAGVYFMCTEGSSAYSTLNSYQYADGTDPALTILFHEYAHHMMFQYERAQYPQWYIEGFAEYMATAFIKDNTISLGYSSPDRIWELQQ